MSTDDDQRETSEAAASRRAAPTIDLDPSQVTDTTPGAGEKPQADQSEADQPRADKPRTGWRARFGGSRAKDPKDESADTAVAAAPVPSRIILAAVFSAAVVALLVSGVWNVLSPGSSDPDIPPAQTATIEDLNARVAHLEDRPAAPADVGALTKRLDALDGALAAIRNDIKTLRDQTRDAAAKMAALEKSAAVEPSVVKIAPDLSGIEGRLAQIEQQVVRAEAAKPAAPPSQDDAALRRALAASALDQAVRQGLPYAAALATASRLDGGAADALKSLAPFAATGVPGTEALSRELLAQLSNLPPAREDKPATSSWLDHLRASAARLVRVSRIDQAGSDRVALLARAKAAAGRNDLKQAEEIVVQLPEADRGALQGWTGKVHARAAALAASRTFNQAAVAALPAPSH